ncbi:hypothetical protein BJ508DRAFT_412722 [Ascobolus immersus RN42]|uniref:Uncharacterized protein n=1 Tax=Ascobolus immersus RN42 TaxID=1160509 RepID=A0A3N4IHZ2_ASCIM|nr:hypothetical protein BJ508DRAFT_412722 [Ascobolus immersus RN42]
MASESQLYLPYELRVEIIQYLQHEPPEKGRYADPGRPVAGYDSRRVALWALTLTDRLCNKLATPLLYESFMPSVNSLPLLIRTLHSKPELGRYATSLGFYEENNCIPEDPMESLVIHSEQLQDQAVYELAFKRRIEEAGAMVEKAAATFGFTVKKEANLYSFDTNPWLWAFTLLYYLPNLEHIDMTCDEYNKLPEAALWEWLGHEAGRHFVTEGMSSPLCLGRIKTILRARASCEEGREGSLAIGRFLAAITCLPRLQRIDIYRCHFDFAGPLGWWDESHTPSETGLSYTIPPRCLCNLQILDIEMAHFHPEALESIFKLSARLRIVNLIVGPGQGFLDADYFNMEDDTHAVDYFASAFEYLRDSLEELRITVSELHEEWGEGFFLAGDQDACGWIGDLSGFSKLRRLETDWHFWSIPDKAMVDGRPARSDDYLPERLEYLKITGEKGHNPDGEFADYEGPYEKSKDAWRLPTFHKRTYLDIPPSDDEEEDDGDDNSDD